LYRDTADYILLVAFFALLSLFTAYYPLGGSVMQIRRAVSTRFRRILVTAAALLVVCGVATPFALSQLHHPGKVLGTSASAAHTGSPKVATPTPASSTPKSTPTARSTPSATPGARLSLDDPRLKELANELVDTAENSTTQWWKQYRYIEHLPDGRGYTAGLVGFCSGTGDMLELVKYYDQIAPGNILHQYVPELERLDAAYAAHNYDVNPVSGDVSGLGPNFVSNWQHAADTDPLLREAQRWERDRVYFDPAKKLAKEDGLHALGLYAYYDASVNMGSALYGGFLSIRTAAMKVAQTPAQGGDEGKYLNAFLHARLDAMNASGDYGPIRRVEVQLQFVSEKKLDLQFPLKFRMYRGDYFDITALPTPHD
jgi:chitosanase